MKPWILSFHDGAAAASDRVGGPAARVAAGLPTPLGFRVESEAAASWLRDERWPDAVKDALAAAVAKMAAQTQGPLVLWVRAADVGPGAPEPLEGVGLHPGVLPALEASLGEIAAKSLWVSFLRAWGEGVIGIHATRFQRLDGVRAEASDGAALSVVATGLIDLIHSCRGSVPGDVLGQVTLAIESVWRAHGSARAKYQRRVHGVAETDGPAVEVMVLPLDGSNETRGTGTVWSRDPTTGAAGLRGSWREGGWTVADSGSVGTLPDAVVHALAPYVAGCEKLLRDGVAIRYLMSGARVWVLDARPMPRATLAAIQVAVDLANEGVIDRSEALMRVDPASLESLLRPTIAPGAIRRSIAKGLGASQGAATGRVCFTADECLAMREQREPAILVRVDASAEDIVGLGVAAGILTTRGGQTSHVAIAAREKGLPAVVSCSEITVDYTRSLLYAGDNIVGRGDWISLDGSTGDVLLGRAELVEPPGAGDALRVLLGWADSVARVAVRANADAAADAARARSFGAVGIGLCRTERMFYEPDALRALRRAILAEDGRARARALADALPLMREQFRALFSQMAGFPVTIRLLDPPLHEFLPRRPEDVASVALELGLRTETLAARVEQLAEVNPMLGLRGVRVGITRPEIYRAQVRAIFEAACQLTAEGVAVAPEILVPLVSAERELRHIRAIIVEVAEQVVAEHNVPVTYQVGTMIELPRAALLADRLAGSADFFSFGTNDLTQMVWGLSREDQGRFIPLYLAAGVLEGSPVARFDVDGVGALVRIAVEKGRAAKPRLGLGACGEHAGDPSGIAFFHDVGLDHVSCSPFRVPVARLAAAQVALGRRAAKAP